VNKYSKLSADIIENVGGKSNIISLTNCFTRLRFNLVDESLANDMCFEQNSEQQIKGVTGLVKSNGQYMIVIGTHVGEVCREIKDQIGLDEDSKTDTEKKNLTISGKLLDYVTAIFMPCLGILCACGMIKGFNSLFNFLGLYSIDSGIYLLTNAIGDSIFTYFPIYLGYTTAKKLKMNPFLGLAIATSMVYPEIQNVDLTFGSFVINTTYVSTVLPVIIVVFLAKPINYLCEKYIPTLIRSFFSPIITLLISVIIGFLLIGPATNELSGMISGLLTTISNASPVLAGIIIGGLYPLLIIIGVHGPIVMMGIMNVMQNGSDLFMALIGLQMFATAGVILALLFKTKDKKLKESCPPAIISALFGISEPAIYGIMLPKVKPFIYACIASACGGLYLGITGTKLYQLAGMGVFSLAGFLGGDNMSGNLVNACIGYLIALVAGFAITYILYKEYKEEK